jgi:dipeptidyl aminopeptidase/acylaminoacyl peptidase
MRSALLWFGFFLLISPIAQAQKHPFTFEDMMKLKRVEEPEVSPDGKWVLFAAVDVDLKANTKTPHVWVVPLNAASNDATPDKKAGSSTAPKDSPAKPSASLGMTGEGNVGGTYNSEHEIISDQDADRPRWAPDGKRFAFISTKESGSQIWIADFDDATGTVTAKHRLTDIPTEAGGELWSPDGKNILFTSDIYPECESTPEAEARCNENKVKAIENSKVKALVFTHLLYRHWNAYKAGKRTHLFVVPALAVFVSGRVEVSVGDATGPARDLTPGDYDAPVFSLGGQDDYAFSPDGQEICYAANHDPEPAISTNNDLFTVPVNFPPDATPKDVLAATKDITAENQAADNTPLYSPDGKYIAYRAQQRPGYESDRWRLTLYDRKTGEKRSITETFCPTLGAMIRNKDPWVGSFVWAIDSQSIFFVAEVDGNASVWVTPVYQPESPRGVVGIIPPSAEPHQLGMPSVLVGVVGGAPRSDFFATPADQGGYDDDLAVTPDGRDVVFTRMSIYAPTEIYFHEIYPDKPQWPPVAHQVTHLNDEALSHVAMSELNFFIFQGANNERVEGFLVKPPNFDPNKKYPVKFLIHGGPQGAWGDDWSYRWNPELFAASGYAVVMINFHGSTGYGQKFIDSINQDWGGAPFEDLMKGLDYAEQHYPFIDKDRECALGASYGGYMANWVLGHTDRFKCIVTHDGMFNPFSAWGTTEELWFNNWEFGGTPYTAHDMYNKWSPRNSSPNFKTPTLVIHGQLDYRLDLSEGLQLFTTLQVMGVPSKMLYFPDEGHWVLKPQNSQLWYKTVNDWVDQWVGKSAARSPTNSGAPN